MAVESMPDGGGARPGSRGYVLAALAGVMLALGVIGLLVLAQRGRTQPALRVPDTTTGGYPAATRVPAYPADPNASPGP
jgi:hypothetical protein